jgi:hypothetical protein
MATRDDLKALIDQVPDSRLEMIQRMLDHHIHPPAPKPEIERMRHSGQQYKERALKQFKETRKPGTLGAASGSGFLSEHEGVPFGREGFHYWDDKALVDQTLHFFDGHKIEIMERLSFSADRTALICALEISSGGRTVRHEDAFPVARRTGTDI